MCGEPLDLLSMEVDHVIPETLLDTPEQLAAVLTEYDLPAGFNLQSFANWLPACGPCNNRKRSRVFKATTRIQLDLEIAGEKAEQAQELSERRVSNQQVAKSWNAIERAAASRALDEDLLTAISEFVAFHSTNRPAEAMGAPLHLTPLLEVLTEKDGVRIVRGPYGVGAGPIVFDERSNFRCVTCGHVAWNGARCVVCGTMDDD